MVVGKGITETSVSFPGWPRIGAATPRADHMMNKEDSRDVGWQNPRTEQGLGCGVAQARHQPYEGRAEPHLPPLPAQRGQSPGGRLTELMIGGFEVGQTQVQIQASWL